MAGEIRINTAAVAQAANSIGSINIRIRNDFSNVVNEINILSNSWKGEAAEKAREAFFSIEKAYSQDRFSVVDNFVTILRNQISDGYVQTENETTKLADLFK
ncbi:MAG: WXG100 family type VII secretion target [Oscillospiraceae bacterium]|jgi:WXG100 family type VII secretion target|nr:WXG100 family type VII secretion target [Oscillospiraceae bacterium]